MTHSPSPDRTGGPPPSSSGAPGRRARLLILERVLLAASLAGVQGMASAVRLRDEAGARALVLFYAPILATAETFLARTRSPGSWAALRALLGMALSGVAYFGGALAAFRWMEEPWLASLAGFLSSFAALPGIRRYSGRWR